MRNKLVRKMPKTNEEAVEVLDAAAVEVERAEQRARSADWRKKLGRGRGRRLRRRRRC